MATDDVQTETETETEVEMPAETAASKTGADKTTEQLKAEVERIKAENERIKKAHAENNRKSAADRARLADIDREKQEREDAKLGEAEQLRKQLKALEDQKRESDQRAAQLEADLLERRIDMEIERAATGLFVSPSLAPKVIDRDRIVHDPDTGKITGIKEAVEAALKKYSEIGGAQRGGGSPAAMTPKRPGGGGAGGAGSEKQDLRAEFARAGGYEPL